MRRAPLGIAVGSQCYFGTGKADAEAARVKMPMRLLGNTGLQVFTHSGVAGDS